MSASSDSHPSRPPIVEERIRIALSCAACLKRIARLAMEPHGIPLFADLQSFARVASQFASAFDEHVRAIEASLPASATNLAAPSPKKAASSRRRP
jgi:hypothetical protein